MPALRSCRLSDRRGQAPEDTRPALTVRSAQVAARQGAVPGQLLLGQPLPASVLDRDPGEERPELLERHLPDPVPARGERGDGPPGTDRPDKRAERVPPIAADHDRLPHRRPPQWRDASPRRAHPATEAWSLPAVPRS